MPKIHITRVTVTALLKIPESVLEAHLVASPTVVGEELARQVLDYAQRAKLGYFPALEYFENVDDAIEADLLDTVRGISWFVGNLVRRELQQRLRAAFSNVHVQDVHLVAFTMPGVRPSDPNALHHLTLHFTPDRVKVVMELSSVEKRPHMEGVEKLAVHKVHRWLDEHFEEVEITSATAV